MNEPRTIMSGSEANTIAAARLRWLDANERASKLSAELFQPGEVIN